MNRVCFHAFGRPIYWYGVMVATGFLAGVVNWHFILSREKRSHQLASDLGFWLMLSGILGARIAYVLANIRVFAANPLDIIRLDQGGLVFYGGLIAASLTTVILARVRGESLWGFADFAITAVPIGHALGRVGCFLNGCCYGTLTNSPLAILRGGELRHPVQLYEAALDLILYAALLRTYFSRRKDGTVLAFYLIGYGLIRFCVEFLRGDERIHIACFTLAQVISMVFVLAGAGLLLVLPGKTSRISRIQAAGQKDSR